MAHSLREEGTVEKKGKMVAAVSPGLLFKANALLTKCLVEWHVFAYFFFFFFN